MVRSGELTSTATSEDSFQRLLVLEPARHQSGIPPLLLEARRHLLGSDGDCTFRLNIPGVQPRHCLILPGPHGPILKAWDNRTWLNDRPVTEAGLREGDRLAIGPVELRLRRALPDDLLRWVNGSDSRPKPLAETEPAVESPQSTAPQNSPRVLEEPHEPNHDTAASSIVMHVTTDDLQTLPSELPLPSNTVTPLTEDLLNLPTESVLPHVLENLPADGLADPEDPDAHTTVGELSLDGFDLEAMELFDPAEESNYGTPFVSAIVTESVPPPLNSPRESRAAQRIAELEDKLRRIQASRARQLMQTRLRRESARLILDEVTRRSAELDRREQQIIAERAQVVLDSQALDSRQKRQQDELSSEEQQLDQQRDELAAELETLSRQRRELADREQRLASMQSLADQVRSAAERKRSLLAELADEVLKQQAELETRRKALDHDQRMLANQSTESAADRAELETQQSELQRRAAELAMREVTLQSRSAEVQDRLKCLATHEQELDENRRHLESQQQFLDVQARDLEARGQTLSHKEDRLNQLVSTLSDREARVAQSESRCDQEASRLAKRQEEIRLKEASLESALAEAATDRQQLQARAAELERCERQVAEQRASLDHEKADLADAAAELSQRESAVADLESLREELHRREQSLQQQQADLDALQEGLLRQQTDLEGRARRVSDAEQRHADLVAQEAQLGQLATALQEQAQEIEGRAAQLPELEALKQDLLHRTQELAEAARIVAAERQQLTSREELLARREEQWLQRLTSLETRDNALAEAQRQIAEREHELARRAADLDQAEKAPAAAEELACLEAVARHLDDQRRELAEEAVRLADHQARLAVAEIELQSQTRLFAEEKAAIEEQAARLAGERLELDQRRQNLAAIAALVKFSSPNPQSGSAATTSVADGSTSQADAQEREASLAARERTAEERLAELQRLEAELQNRQQQLATADSQLSDREYALAEEARRLDAVRHDIAADTSRLRATADTVELRAAEVDQKWQQIDEMLADLADREDDIEEEWSRLVAQLHQAAAPADAEEPAATSTILPVASLADTSEVSAAEPADAGGQTTAIEDRIATDESTATVESIATDEGTATDESTATDANIAIEESITRDESIADDEPPVYDSSPTEGLIEHLAIPGDPRAEREAISNTAWLDCDDLQSPEPLLSGTGEPATPPPAFIDYNSPVPEVSTVRAESTSLADQSAAVPAAASLQQSLSGESLLAGTFGDDSPHRPAEAGSLDQNHEGAPLLFTEQLARELGWEATEGNSRLDVPASPPPATELDWDQSPQTATATLESEQSPASGPLFDDSLTLAAELPLEIQEQGQIPPDVQPDFASSHLESTDSGFAPGESDAAEFSSVDNETAIPEGQEHAEMGDPPPDWQSRTSEEDEADRSAKVVPSETVGDEKGLQLRSMLAEMFGISELGTSHPTSTADADEITDAAAEDLADELGTSEVGASGNVSGEFVPEDDENSQAAETASAEPEADDPALAAFSELLSRGGDLIAPHPEAASAVENSVEPEASEPPEAESEDDSIAAYMEKLLARTRQTRAGVSAQSHSSGTEKPTPASAASLPSRKVDLETEQPEMTPELPAAEPPILQRPKHNPEDIRLRSLPLRAVANLSARTALARFARKRHRENFIFKVATTAVSAVVLTSIAWDLVAIPESINLMKLLTGALVAFVGASAGWDAAKLRTKMATPKGTLEIEPRRDGPTPVDEQIN